MKRIDKAALALVTVFLSAVLLLGCEIPGACYKQTRLLSVDWTNECRNTHSGACHVDKCRNFYGLESCYHAFEANTCCTSKGGRYEVSNPEDCEQ